VEFLPDVELSEQGPPRNRRVIMSSIEKALQIAAKAQEGQKDKEGLPYFLA
jgi:hypothetical protein